MLINTSLLKIKNISLSITPYFTDTPTSQNPVFSNIKKNENGYITSLVISVFNSSGGKEKEYNLSINIFY